MVDDRSDWRIFEECSEEERKALDALHAGAKTDSLNPEIVTTLTEKFLLEPLYLPGLEPIYVISTMVWHQWGKFKEETGWTSKP